MGPGFTVTGERSKQLKECLLRHTVPHLACFPHHFTNTLAGRKIVKKALCLGRFYLRSWDTVVKDSNSELD